MPLFAVLLTSLFFSAFAFAGVVYSPTCDVTYEWSANSLGQNPCTVSAYLESTCAGGTFSIPALQPGSSYSGPTGSDDSDLCKCNTVVYSLLSACDACQGGQWLSWADYKYNCTTVLSPSSFPNPVPAGTSVPHWALIDVTAEGTWDAVLSLAAGDTPEAGPGTTIGTP